MTYSNLPVCDLRHIEDVEAIKNIELIEEVAVLVLPEDADENIKSLLSTIPQKNVATTIYIKKNIDIKVVNGCIEIDNGNFFYGSESLTVVNGIVIVGENAKNLNGKFIVNGMVIINNKIAKACNLQFPMLNGMVKYFDFDSYKIYNNNLTLDADTLKYISPNTLIIVGNTLDICEGVNVEMLSNKNIILIAGNEIKCNKSIAGFVKATAIYGNCVIIKDE